MNLQNKNKKEKSGSDKSEGKRSTRIMILMVFNSIHYNSMPI